MVCTVSTKEEIRKAITQLTNGKAAGPDDIPAEALKVNIRISLEILHPLIVPTEWKKRYLIELPKRSQSLFTLLFTLMSIPGKVFNRVLLNRLKAAVDPYSIIIRLGSGITDLV